ncbi:MAG: 50S ribosomal protein L5 [bacterium]
MRLSELYKKEIIPRLKEKFGYTNDMDIPRLSKVSLNVGVGRFSKDKNYIEGVIKDLTVITGQKPMIAKARKSISAFKVREGDSVGIAVTLRGEKMYDFVDKLVNVTLPRVRDFRGISPKKLDNKGNITIGFKDQTAFPEIRLENVEKTHGLEVSIETTAQNKEQGQELLSLLGFPFSK